MKLTLQIAAGIVVGLLIGLPAPVKAQNDACNRAVAEAQYQVEQKNTTVIKIDRSDMRRSGETYLPDYPMKVHITIDGSGAESVMYSPVFLTKLSHDIIMSCGSVSLVVFGVNKTDWSERFGLMENREVTPFKCLSGVEGWIEGGRTVIPWGYAHCL